MDKQFFSQNNYIALKEIISSVAGISFNTKDDERKLYEHMVHTYDTTKTDNFHDLNKKCISIYTDRFERQIPTNNELNNQQSNGNIINPVQSSIQSNTIKPISLDNESSGIESIIEEENPMDLFAKLKEERSNAYEIQSSKQNYERPVNSIQSDLEETFQNGQDLNQFHDMDRSTHNFSSDNLMNSNNHQENKFDGVIQNSIDKTDDDYDTRMEKTQIITPDRNTYTTLNPFSYFQQGSQNKENLKTIERETIIIIDSKDRDLELYPNTNNYQVKFGGNSDTIEIPTHLNENGVIVHETATLYRAYQGANVNIVLKNIKYVQLINVTVPYTPVYYNGNPPVTYSDENQTSNTLSLLAGAYLPNFKHATGTISSPKPTKATGIPLDILDEPYLLIHIDEINTDSWYRSTNPETDGAFARVMNPSIISSHTNAPFAIFQPQTVDERMTYYPTLLSSLDKMTLHIKGLSNNHIDIGQDKMYVKTIERSQGEVINSCLNVTAKRGTDITIETTHPDYISEGCTNNVINNHNLQPGDTVYFYDTKPCNNEHIYKLNKEQTHIKYDPVNKTFEIKYKYNTTTKDNKNITERILSLRQYLFIGDFISVSGNLFKINNWTDKKAVIEDKDITKYNTFLASFPSDFTNNFEVGFVRQNKKGFTSNNRCGLNSRRGHKVVYIYEDEDSAGNPLGTSKKFTIDLPFGNISANYDEEYYIGNTVFFIKKKLQTSYMFKITTVHKENEKFESELV